MNRTTAIAAQWVGRATVVIALVLLIWTVADLAGSSDSSLSAVQLGPNEYLSAVVTSTTLAVPGMLAIALGTILARFSDE